MRCAVGARGERGLVAGERIWARRHQGACHPKRSHEEVHPSRGLRGLVVMSLHHASRHPHQASFRAIVSQDVHQSLILVDSEMVRESLAEFLNRSSGVC